MTKKYEDKFSPIIQKLRPPKKGHYGFLKEFWRIFNHPGNAFSLCWTMLSKMIIWLTWILDLMIDIPTSISGQSKKKKKERWTVKTIESAVIGQIRDRHLGARCKKLFDSGWTT
jgi:hypothetical protein